MTQSSISTYGNYELGQAVDLAPWLIRDESANRADKVARKIIAMQAKLAKLEAEREELFGIHAKALAEISRVQAEG